MSTDLLLEHAKWCIESEGDYFEKNKLTVSETFLVFLICSLSGNFCNIPCIARIAFWMVKLTISRGRNQDTFLDDYGGLI